MCFAPCLLWTHVGRRADKRASFVKPLAAERKSEITEVGSSRCIEENVRRLDVAVVEAMLVGVMQRVGNAHDDPQRFGDGNLLTLHPQLEVAPTDPFRNDVAGTVGRPAGIVDGDDGGMVQASEGSCLGEEDLDALRIGILM